MELKFSKGNQTYPYIQMIQSNYLLLGRSGQARLHGQWQSSSTCWQQQWWWGVLVVKPHAPYLAVQAANLQTLSYNQLGTLTRVQVSFRLGLGGTRLAVLRADPFRVPARGTQALPYVASAQGVTLGDAGRDAMEAAVREKVVGFKLDGEARAR
ncbi:hypothetical protein BDA96_07G056800 [Sorghum bicolor]|uniref:Late embryogenesis abundant protein LEA-2 subgroup domain-containing protein n=2 Tax=Sorghum bicolor TaxID=4558 RepID=A0A921QIQ0_SORBI|nr:hypothetical protein BDA96_07G056800 [Sorghum bicolor]OQU79962.1 hypothetical protein SORBI_3007G054300 [Sorghum bicolor]